MPTATVKARLTRGLSVLTSGDTVVMTFKLQVGKDEHFALPVAAIPEIVERLVVAHNNSPNPARMLYFGHKERDTPSQPATAEVKAEAGSGSG